MALLSQYYVNWQTGNDSQDGDAAVHTTGTTGPKKHINEILDLIKNPTEVVDGTITINVAGDYSNPSSYVYQDSTDDSIDISTLNMSNPNARIVFMLTGFDTTKYEGGSEAPDGGSGWAVAGTKPATIAPMTVDNARVGVMGLGVSDSTGQLPVVRVGQFGDVTLDYCRLSGGFAGLRGEGTMNLVNSCVTGNEIGVFVEGATVLGLIGRNVIHDNGAVGLRVRQRSIVTLFPWWTLPVEKFQTTISTAAPKGAYAAVLLEGDSMLTVSDILPDFFNGSRDIHAAAELQIVNTSLVKSTRYFGVVLKERSLLTGASLVRFNDPALNDGKDTILGAAQIVQSPGEGTLVVG